jgi:hypothetical protein
VVGKGEDGRNSSQNALSACWQLSRPKKSVRVDGVIQKWKKTAKWVKSVHAGHGLGRANTWILPGKRWNAEQWTLLCPFNRWTKAGLSAWSGQLSQTVSFYRVSACPHTANKTLETIRDLKLELLNILFTDWTSLQAISTCSDL